MIPFNVPAVLGTEINYINEAIKRGKFSGDGWFTSQCSLWFKENCGAPNVLMTTSCTHALEMAAMLAGIEPGDEVIMPSYTFVSTANAFALRGAKVVFVDVRPDTMNMDEMLIESAITTKTKAIVPVHYAGVACEMDAIMKLALKYNLIVIEDAAQGVMSKYKEKYLGTIGHIGCYSFHETKNYNCGEGGAIVINDSSLIQKAEIIREKGTNRTRFFRGEVDKYTWVDVGSSYLPSELNAAFLYAQLEQAQQINDKRIQLWNKYYSELSDLSHAGWIELPHIPRKCEHNGHMFYIKLRDLEERTELIGYLKDNNIHAVFHYVPLHSSEAGYTYSRFDGQDNYTTQESERLLRLPLFYSLEEEDVVNISSKIHQFYQSKAASRDWRDSYENKLYRSN